MSKLGSKSEPSLVDTIDLGLSRVRNDNAVESVVKSLNPKHEKRLIQVRVFCYARFVSAWQKRNVHALHERSKPSPSKVNVTRMNAIDGGREGGKGGLRRVLPYETIERVELARLDTLPRVTTKELLVRCAEIRKQSRDSLKDLARAKHEFVEAEIQWESTRRDPIELLRRKVKASACEGNEVMIGNQEFIYSAF
ncbi:hypothetical protein DYB34_003650 [Aphanomyces astaci]|uniref:Uncharacterized protein n=1 Tax=Aphanomyces astaci TaxID=112090 RepID=A0A418BY23_APHAT|nr:hypothetical protein DYB34_003650 [Aphanomyces astaci]